MPRSRIIPILLFSSTLLSAETGSPELSDTVSASDSLVIWQQLNSSQAVRHFIQQMQKKHEASGRLSSELTLTDLRWSEDSETAIEASWRVSSEKPASVDSVVVVGLDIGASEKLARTLQFVKSSPPSHETLLKAHRFLNGISFVHLERTPFFAGYATEQIALVVPLREEFHNSFLGTLGSQTRNDGTRRLIGEFRFHARICLERLQRRICGGIARMISHRYFA